MERRMLYWAPSKNSGIDLLRVLRNRGSLLTFAVFPPVFSAFRKKGLWLSNLADIINHFFTE